MTTQGSFRNSLLCAFALVVVATAPASVATATGSAGVITVGDSDDAEFTSVQAAVDAASSGDTIHVEPGVYREQVTVDTAVTLIAPRGATLNGSTLGEYARGVKIRTDGKTVVEGFTITGYSVGIDGDGNEVGNWVVRNTTVTNTSWAGVSGGSTTGDWHLRNVTIRDSQNGIYARSSDGAWRVTDTTIRNITSGDGVDALAATGDWVLDNVTVREADHVGFMASHNAGDWRIQNSTIDGATVGVAATSATGNWTVSGSNIRNTSVSERYDFWQPRLTEGVGIDASKTNGSWAVHRTQFVNNSEGAIVAENADPAGNATHNRLGESTSEACVGNVTCSQPLPTETEQSRTPTPSATPVRTLSPTPPTPPTPAASQSDGTEITPQGALGVDGPGGLLSVAVVGLVAAALAVRYRRR